MSTAPSRTASRAAASGGHAGHDAWIAAMVALGILGSTGLPAQRALAQERTPPASTPEPLADQSTPLTSVDSPAAAGEAGLAPSAAATTTVQYCGCSNNKQRQYTYSGGRWQCTTMLIPCIRP